MKKTDAQNELNELSGIIEEIEKTKKEFEQLKTKKELASLQADAIRGVLDELVHEKKLNARLKALTGDVSDIKNGVSQQNGRLAESRQTNQLLIAALAAGGPPTAPAKPAPSLLFGDLIPEFVADKQRKTEGVRPWLNQTLKQSLATYRLWTEIVGVKPLREYTGADAGFFREMLLRLPSSHSKNGNPTPALEAIKKNETEGKPTLSMKTAKRHFSSLNQYWTWLRPRGHVDDTIFKGFQFPGAKSSRRKRDDWAPSDLEKLFRSSWYTTEIDKTSAFFWLPLIGLHSGMRIEEIARLRLEDIQIIADSPCFVIQPHPDGWTPKTEAGERIVPIHDKLINFGFLKFVEICRKNKNIQLFIDLKQSGPDKNYSTAFSRLFGKYKQSLGIPAKTVFHSFRHSARTLLTNTSAEIREVWINALLGHEAENAGEGVKTYTKRVDIKFLKLTVNAIQPDVDLSHLVLKSRDR